MNFFQISIKFLILVHHTVICIGYFSLSNDTYDTSYDNYFELLPEIPLNSNYDIDYKTVYNLRFDPTSIRKTGVSVGAHDFFHLNQNQNSEYDRNILSITTTMNTVNDDLSDSDTDNEFQTKKNFSSSYLIGEITPMNEEYLNKLEKLPSITASTLTSTSSNIMKPNKIINNPLIVIGNRLKDLLFGTGKTFVKRPPTASSSPPLPSPSSLISSQSVTHHSKFLNLFDAIRLENRPCTAYNGVRMLNGTCYYRFECDNYGGMALGYCATRHTVCCIFRYSCSGTTNQPISYFESPRFPIPYKEQMACTFTLNLLPNIRQVRLDFLFFEIRRPTEGDCIEDQFIVLGQNRNYFVPIICGINSGQHIYIDVEYSMERRLFLSIFGKTSSNRSFSIRIIQLKNDYAPKGCLQYFTDNFGIIKSFNYDDVGNVVDSRRGSYFNNLNYVICIRRSPDKCAITYSNEVNGEEFEFEIIDSLSDMREERNLVPDPNADVSLAKQDESETEDITNNCSNDFITINSIRLCGNKLNDGSIPEESNTDTNIPVTDYGNGPIILPFRTDNQTVGKGYKLLYFQENCN